VALSAFVVTACSGGGGAARTDDVEPTASGSAAVTSSAPAASCAAAGVAAPAGCWQKVLPLGSGGFPPAPGSQNVPLWEPGKFPLTLRPQVAIDDELWMAAQVVAYSSPDGLTWTEHAKTDWGERIYQTLVSFQGKLWMFGGLDYDSGAFLNDIWVSSDGTTWENAGTAPWSPRGGQAMAVHQGRLWLFGGADHAAEDRSTDGFLNDVWVSDDGLKWTQVTAAAPWAARDQAAVVPLGEALYLIGGQGLADVWRTADGREWSPVVREAPWKPRHDPARLAFDGKLWVFGGWSGETTNALNDVWFSSDGATWARQAERAPWAERAPISVVFDDRIWIYSGKHTGADDNWGGDLWQMSAVTTQAS